MPVMRAMPLAFPGNALTRAYDTQFMCGDALLVAPIIAAGGEVDVALPPGAWYDLATRQRVAGRQVIRYRATLDRFPVFGREGHALPLGPVVQHTGEIDRDNPLNALWVFGKPAHALDGFAQASIALAADGATVTRGIRRAGRSLRRLYRRPHRRSDLSAAMTAATIVVTIGEPAGIGPDLAVRLAERTWPARLVLAGDCELLRERARRLGAGVRLVPYLRGRAATPGALEVAHFPVAVPVQAGRLDAANARTVIASLDAALAGCLSGEFAAMVTAPVQKSVINDAGIHFTGHTEFLAQRTGAPGVVMLLVGAAPWGSLRVALATTHLPLAAVPAAITRETLTQTLRIVVADLERKFGIAKPRLGVCGLNPHAGEGGYLGREEIDVIAPVADRAARRRARRRRAVAGRHGLRSGQGARLRLHRRDVSRSGAAGAQARELRPRRQRDAGSADRAHLGRPRHRARPRRRRRAGSRRRSGLAVRGGRAGDRPRRRGPDAAGRRDSLASPAQAIRPAFPGRSALHRAHRRGDRTGAEASASSKSARAWAR